MLLWIGIVVKSDSSRNVLQEGIAVKRDSGLKALRYGTVCTVTKQEDELRYNQARIIINCEILLEANNKAPTNGA